MNAAAGTQAEAQSQMMLVGMGLVAGTSVFVLTLLWASCLIAGRCDLVTNPDGVLEARHKTLTKEFSLSGQMPILDYAMLSSTFASSVGLILHQEPC